ncbi:MAG: hypothetical protein P8075_15760 [Deltaproteobacteria bacterium]
MLREERTFLVVMSITIGALVSSITLVGKHLSTTESLLMGLVIALFYPVFIIAMVRFSVALKSWAYGKKFDNWVASGRETVRTYLLILFPIVLPVLVVYHVSFGIINRVVNYKTA